MTQTFPTKPVRTDCPVLVYTRAKENTGWPLSQRVNGEQGNWQFDPYLQADVVDRRGTVSTATLRYVPVSEAERPIENSMAHYTTDDQVQIRVLPADDEGVDQQADEQDNEQRGRVLFEGIMQRMHPTAGRRGGNEIEQLMFTAFDMTRLDRRTIQHCATGRWLLRDGKIYYPSSPDFLPVVNFKGKPNMSKDGGLFAARGAHQFGPEGGFHTWTHDDDPDAEFWTLRKFLGSLFAWNLFGAWGSPLNRNMDLSADTRKFLLSQEDDGDPRVVGIDSPLDELNIYSADVIANATAACNAAGFDCFVEPVDDATLAASDEDGGVDRRHQIRIQRHHTGNRKYFLLAPRGSTYSPSAEFHKHNDVSLLAMTRDAAEIRNEIDVVARCQVECRIELRPLWKDDDEFSGDITAQLQHNPKQGTDPDDWTDYQKRYLPGGPDSAKYADVYRVWGVACTGKEPGKSSSFYAHDQSGYWLQTGGFDWVDYLELDSVYDVRKAREDANIPTAEKIVWSNRVRQLLPIASPPAKARGMQYILEVSEDGGATWSLCPLRVQTLSNGCGVRLDIKNPACINNDKLTTGATKDPAIDKSWLSLINDDKLAFRITACVPADHAERYRAPRNSATASDYTASQWMTTRGVETWIHPDATSMQLPGVDDLPWLSDGTNSWRKVVDMAQLLKKLAESRRDHLSDAVWSVTNRNIGFNLDRYQMGDQIAGIEGRGVDFGTNAGGTTYYPTVVGIKFNLASGQQGVDVTLDDFRQTEGIDG